MLRLLAAAALMYVLMRSVLPRLVGAMARSQELLLIFAIAWGTGLAALGEWAGFSKEAGAFMAGFSLASTTYREAMNARLTGILGSAMDAIISTGPDQRILYFNPAAERILGWRASEVLGQNVSMLMSEPDRSRHDGYLQRYLRGQGGSIVGSSSREVQAAYLGDH